MAKYSARAYVDHTVCDPHTDAQALISELVDEQCLVVAFKGSSAPEDFIQDAKFKMRPLLWEGIAGVYFNRFVHEGFLEDLQAIEKDVVREVRCYLATNPNGKIFVTGHSLGGALAVLGALALHLQGIPIAAVYTFGQPRVGNKWFALAYNARLGSVTFALTNADDPVPLLPPLLAGYRDTGTEVYLPAPCAVWRGCTGREHAVFDPWIGLQIIDDTLGAFDAWRQHKLAFIPNHLLNAYQNKLTPNREL
jgi:hypothetical protein